MNNSGRKRRVDGAFTDTCLVTLGSTPVNDLGMKNIEVYPNPASSKLNIKGLDPGNYRIEGNNKRYIQKFSKKQDLYLILL